MEWIYTRTKVSGQGSLELALEEKKIEILALLVISLHSLFRLAT
jgi:hypothetical protein